MCVYISWSQRRLQPLTFVSYVLSSDKHSLNSVYVFVFCWERFVGFVIYVRLLLSHWNCKHDVLRSRCNEDVVGKMEGGRGPGLFPWGPESQFFTYFLLTDTKCYNVSPQRDRGAQTATDPRVPTVTVHGPDGAITRADLQIRSRAKNKNKKDSVLLCRLHFHED